MILTKGGSIIEELKDIPKRKWWRISMLIPPLLAILLGVIDLSMSEEFHPSFFLIGMLFLLPQITANYLKKKSHRIFSSGLNLLVIVLYFYLLFFQEA